MIFSTLFILLFLGIYELCFVNYESDDDDDVDDERNMW